MQKLILLLFVFSSIGLLAQQTDNNVYILRGKILLHTFEIDATEFSPIADAEIRAGLANPAVSMANGEFKLTFHRLQAGEAIIIDVFKDGYEVVNQDDLRTKVPKHANNQLLNIYMSPRGKIHEHKLRYYNISLEIIAEEYERKISNLSKEKAGWEAERGQLEKEYQQQLKFARELAEKYARTVFTDVSELHKKAFSLFQEGEIDEALQILKDANLVDRERERR